VYRGRHAFTAAASGGWTPATTTDTRRLRLRFLLVRPRDTTPDAAAMQQLVFRRMTGDQRVRMAAQMSEDAREISRCGIRTRHPEYSPVEVEQALRRLLLGDDLVRRAWPDLPFVAP
jgi:hypothetical protein